MLNNGGRVNGLPLTSLNHISHVCRSLDTSLHFYQHVLGFIPIRRPGSFNFDGAWLSNYGIGIHLLQSDHSQDTPTKKEINPKDDHISFQCESMKLVENKLQALEIHYIKRRVEEGGIYVDQIFFHDPDGFMIEICNCNNLPVVPLGIDGEQSAIGVCKRQDAILNNDMKQVQQCLPSAVIHDHINKEEQPHIHVFMKTH